MSLDYIKTQCYEAKYSCYGYMIDDVMSQLPSIMWLIIKKPKRFSVTWFINWVNIYIYIFSHTCV